MTSPDPQRAADQARRERIAREHARLMAAIFNPPRPLTWAEEQEELGRDYEAEAARRIPDPDPDAAADLWEQQMDREWDR